MASTVTVVGRIGPALTLPSKVFSDVKSFTFEDGSEILTIVTTDNKVYQIEIAAAVTITLTVSGTSYTLTIANS